MYAGDQNYANFCTKEVEMWERELNQDEIDELAIFPEYKYVLGPCNKPCGEGTQIATAESCTSYHWGCDHLVVVTSMPVACDIPDCQNLGILRVKNWVPKICQIYHLQDTITSVLESRCVNILEKKKARFLRKVLHITKFQCALLKRIQCINK